MPSLLRQCDQRAGFIHQWEEFDPIGLLIFKDLTAEAIRPVITDTAITVTDACIAAGRAARRDFKRVAGIGVACSAWASQENPEYPATAPDRKRARLIWAADREHLVHLYSNIAGSTHYETALAPPTGIGSLLCQVIAEATFSAWDFCSTGTHERKLLL